MMSSCLKLHPRSSSAKFDEQESLARAKRRGNQFEGSDQGLLSPFGSQHASRVGDPRMTRFVPFESPQVQALQVPRHATRIEYSCRTDWSR